MITYCMYDMYIIICGYMYNIVLISPFSMFRVLTSSCILWSLSICAL